MKKERSKLLDLVDGYEIPKEHRTEKGEPIPGTGKSFFSRALTGSFSGKTRASSRKISQLKNKIVGKFLYTQTRVYGAALLTFGILATLIALLLFYFNKTTDMRSAIITGISSAILGVIFMFSEEPVALAAENFVVTDYLLFEFFCIKRMQKSKNASEGFGIYYGVVLGILLALATLLISPLGLILIIALLFFVIFSFASPEFSFFASLLVLPFTEFLAATTTVLSTLLIITLLSFLRKVISGKRVYVFEQYDALIGIMILFMLISGIFIKGMDSFENSVMLLLGAFGYILTSNLVTNRRLADLFSTALMLTSLPTATIVAVKFLSSSDGAVYTYRAEGFYSTEVLGVFLIAAVLLTASLLKEAKHLAGQAVYSFALTAQMITLVLSGNFLALTVIFLGFFCYLFFKLRRGLTPALLILFALLYLPVFLPAGVTDNVFISSVFGKTGELRSLWAASGKMFLDHPFIGVGMGAESFLEEIVSYGAVGVSDSSNIFIEIACEAGVFALFFFLLVIITCIRHRIEYRPYVRASQVKTVSSFAAVAFVCLMLYGTANYIWSHSAACYLFWCVFGLGSATLRVAKREHDDKIMYYNDVVSSETADIDVQIDGFKLTN